MNTQLTTDIVNDVENTQKLCQMLMQSPHYKKIGPDGIFAIIEMARSIGVDPRQALNNGFYYVRGKVELSALMMNTLIRQKGHSITKDKRSDDTICILHGKRADNGDTWVESYSMEDAKKANIANSPTWKAYTKDMLFARALSRLARQLFPDVIRGCYVEGEVALDTAIAAPSHELLPNALVEEIESALNDFPAYRDELQAYLDSQSMQFADLPLEHAEKIMSRIESLREEATDAAGE